MTDLASSIFMLIDDGTDGLTREAIGIAIAIHKKYGPKLLENAYLRAFVIDLRAAGHAVECQPRIPLVHGGVTIEKGYIPDIIVDRKLVIEVKVVSVLLPVHKQQLLTYMRLTDIKVGLLINFNVPVLRHGIKRLILPQL